MPEIDEFENMLLGAGLQWRCEWPGCNARGAAGEAGWGGRTRRGDWVTAFFCPEHNRKFECPYDPMFEQWDLKPDPDAALHNLQMCLWDDCGTDDTRDAREILAKHRRDALFVVPTRD